MDKKSTFSWCLYDWANSAFGTIIVTFVFSVYFSQEIVGDEIQASSQWSYAIGISGILIAILAPIFGAIADHSGHRKRWIFFFSMLCILCSALLWFAEPNNSSSNLFFILWLVVLGNLGVELGQVFYNAMLPNVAPKERMGQISGWGWAMGYIGGLFALALTLFGLIGFGGNEPFLSLPTENSEHIRASAIVVSLWFFIFMIPMLVFTKDKEIDAVPFAESIKLGLEKLNSTLKHATKNQSFLLFLVASIFYRDGLVTLFAVGGIYAATQFDMNFSEILIFAVGLNIMAGFGSYAFSFLDDRIGSKPTILISLFGLVLCGLAILFTQDKQVFIALTFILGVFIGPVQAASRTMVGRLADPDSMTQAYGLYAFTGKSVAFVGPLVYAWCTSQVHSQQAGMMSIIYFWLVGLVLLSFVRVRYDRAAVPQF